MTENTTNQNTKQSVNSKVSQDGKFLASVFAKNTALYKNLNEYPLDIPKLYIDNSGKVCADFQYEGKPYKMINLETNSPQIEGEKPQQATQQQTQSEPKNVTPKKEMAKANKASEQNAKQAQSINLPNKDTAEDAKISTNPLETPVTSTSTTNEEVVQPEVTDFGGSTSQKKNPPVSAKAKANAEDAKVTVVDNTNEIKEAKTKKKPSPEFDEDSVELSSVFGDNRIKKFLANSYDHNTRVSKTLNPNTKRYQIVIDEFDEKQIHTALDVLSELNINLPSNLKLKEASARYLNDYLDKVYADYFNQRKINITTVYKDPKSGRIIMGNSKEKYFADEIMAYSDNRQEISFDKYDPLTKEDIANIQGQLTKFFDSYKMPMDGINSKVLSSLKNIAKGGTVAKFTVGNIIRDSSKAPITESRIKKFKEADSTESIFDTYAKVKYGNKIFKESPSMEIEINTSIFAVNGIKQAVNGALDYLSSVHESLKLNEAIDPSNITNSFVKDLGAISDIQTRLAEELNKKGFVIEYTANNVKTTYSIVYEIGNSMNTRFLQDKGVVVFSLKCYKVKGKSKEMKQSAGGKFLKGLVNTLATASGAVVQGDKNGQSGTAGTHTL